MPTFLSGVCKSSANGQISQQLHSNIAQPEYQARLDLGFNQTMVKISCVFMDSVWLYLIFLPLLYFSDRLLILLYGLKWQLHTKYPYLDPCYGLYSAYGPQITVCLPRFFYFLLLLYYKSLFLTVVKITQIEMRKNFLFFFAFFLLTLANIN